MAPRSIWKGSMGFGMVNVPVKLYSATEEKTVHFNQIHRDCQTRIQMPKWCPACERKVEAGELIKGYPLGDDQYILMEEADFASLPVKSLKTIEVVEFVDASRIDPRHYSKSYFVSPDDAGVKAFSLFIQAMEQVSLIGIAKLSYREREHLATIRAFDGVILLQTLFYSDELRSAQEIRPSVAQCSEKEMEMAITLIKTLVSDEVDLSKFQDEYRRILMMAIEARAAGQPITVTALKEAPKMDLVDALMASIEQQKEKVPVEAIRQEQVEVS